MKRKHKVIAKAYNRKGHCIAEATNSYTKTHTVQAKYAKRAGNENAIFLHAEIAVLIKAREPVYRLEISRYDAKGNPVLARPCRICMEAIQEAKVKEVIHT